jgi:hypothetical protein
MRRFRHVAEPPLVVDELRLNRPTLEQNLAMRGFKQSGDDVHRGALAGSVGAQIAQNFVRV